METRNSIKYKMPMGDYRYTTTEIRCGGKVVHAVIEKLKRTRYMLTVIELGSVTFYGSLAAAKQAVEEMNEGSIELAIS
jgi:starvation-inducible outer membrane lipoprotein